MNAVIVQRLLAKLKTLSPPQVAQVGDFVEFLAAKSRRRAAFDQLLAIAPALEAAGAEPLSEEAVATEINAARQARKARAVQESPVDATRSLHQRGVLRAAVARQALSIARHSEPASRRLSLQQSGLAGRPAVGVPPGPAALCPGLGRP